MRIFGSFLFLIVFCLVTVSATAAQETEEKVVDEVVAVVNDDVITLSKVRREIDEIVKAGVTQGKKREDAQREVEEKRGELIANLIHEELIVQKAKELGFDAEIEANVNRRFLEIMKQYNMKTLDALYQEMEKNGVNPQEIREVWKKQATRDLVIQKEVQGKIYWGVSAKDIKDYYEQHKAKFTRPETVTVREIVLSYAGRDENAVREKAKQIVAQLRAGGDFDKIAKENSDPGIVTQDGKPEKLRAAELSPLLSSALKNVAVGSYTEPIAAEQVGVVILRVDAREKATTESYFDENAVRLAIVTERSPAEQKKFLATLRSDSYIKISDSYRPLVSPILFAEDRKEKTDAAPATNSDVKPAPKSDTKPNGKSGKSDNKANTKKTK
ncbi:MAG TPA: peptidyl-prolyl cis-trans isomerase [Pyrinomonadaceae bacterium]|nr:peptidyl-prolyl cis-trans isomerase [Pyrinomonadaceae bacterium]